jgi:ATP-dependent helicase/nuclease subunit A
MITRKTPPLAKNIVVVAGAGTGKTHALVERYLSCLLGLEDDGSSEEDPGGDEPTYARAPDRILAITFTEKAAAEMRARVQRRLGHLLFDPALEAGIVARAHELGRPLPPRLLEDLRRATSQAPIFTFHAFCARVLRDHALAAGLDPAFPILEPDDEHRLLSEIAEACVIDALQRGAGDGGARQVAELVARVALHGFGERKGLVECLVGLHGTLAERGLAPSALPLAARDAGDVARALSELQGACVALGARAAGNAALRCAAIEHARQAVAAAWSSFGGDGRGTPRDEEKDEQDTDDPEAAVAHAFAALQKQAGGNWGGRAVDEERRAVVAAVEALGAALVDAFTADLAPAVRDLLVELDRRQREEKRARGFLGFGDLLVLTRDLLRDDPQVRARVKGCFARILVDEYQDTSPVQEDVLALLLEDGGADRPSATARMLEQLELEPGRVFLVGDPKQSIYGFRGADAGVFSRALGRVAAGPFGAREELAASRRSLAPIVELANLVAAHALPRGPFGVEASQLVALTALRGGEGPAGEHWRVAPRSDEEPALTPHELESLVVARRLQELFEEGRCRAGDVAILVRRGKAAVPLARALGRAGIRAEIVGGDGFYVRPEVSDVIAGLTLATDPSDELAVLTVLRSPLVAVPDDQILALYESLPQRPRGLTWPRAVEACQDARIAEDVRARVRAFDAVLATVQKRLHAPSAPGGPVARAIDALLDDAGYAAACAVEPDATLRLRNLEKLRALAEREDKQRETALVTVARLAAAIDDPPPEPLAGLEADDAAFGAGPDEPTPGAVRIMTIHQAKGLEFPVVVLADAGSGLKGESDDVAFDADVGLAVTARGRPIAACAPKGQRGARAGAVPARTAIQAVRRRLRERNEGELARLLYVALTRARDRLYVVGAPRRTGTGSLLGLLELARDADPARFDALLPRLEVPAALPPRVADAPPAGDEPTPGALAMPAPQPPVRLRVRASELAARQLPQLGLGLIRRAAEDEADRLPPRAAGRLAHAIIALVATEAPAALADPPAIERVVARAARACGVADAPPELLERCARTLGGPVRALLTDGYELSFEEPLWLARPSIVIEGKADLVARRDDRTLVVELKLTEARAGAAPALLQASAYAAALEQRGEPAVHLVTWALGAEPPPPQPFGRALKSRLEKALAAAAPTGSARADPSL